MKLIWGPDPHLCMVSWFALLQPLSSIMSPTYFFSCDWARQKNVLICFSALVAVGVFTSEVRRPVWMHPDGAATINLQ